MRLVSILIALLCFSSPVLGWGEVGHGYVNEAATFGVPAEMPAFFHEAYPRLTWLGYQPDRWRGAGDAADAFNAPNHYLDYEYVAHLELPPTRYEYIDLLYRSGTLDRLGIDNTKPGFLPWRIAELTELLEREWKLWASPDLTEQERAIVEDSILFLSGTLGHFVADAANPHHSTMHYNGWVVAPAPAGYATDCSTHWRFETAYVTREVEVADVFELVASPVVRADYFDAGLSFVRSSFALVHDLYQLDARGVFERGASTSEAYEFTTGRLAAGASLLRDLWYSAYLAGTRSER